MTRVSKIVSAVLSGDQLPHVKRSTSCGANMMPSSVTALMKTAVSVATLFANRHAASSPSTAIFFENVVMKAVESAPSANKSRSRFGSRNAIRNASRFFPAPKRPANTISRIKPSTRLHRMAMATTPVARVLTRRFSTAVIGEQRTVSQDFRKQKKRVRPCDRPSVGQRVRAARFANHVAEARIRAVCPHMCGHFSSQALGQYQLILFKTSFERKGVAAEAIVLTSETDSWQVFDYKFY